jgi:hypothetical protein
MRRFIGLSLIALLPLLLANSAQGEEKGRMGKKMQADVSSRTPMVESLDGDLGPNQYETISLNGSLTRALCPYSCEMRGIPKRNCREWRSLVDPEKCYVEDTRLAQHAVILGKSEKDKKK